MIKNKWLILTMLFFCAVSAGCDSSFSSDPTPTPISMLATNSQNPDVRGEIIGIFEPEGQFTGFRVIGVLEDDTKYDQADVRVTDQTLIYRLVDGEYELASESQLSVGTRVEVLFTGFVRERYPVSAEAAEILIIP